MDKLDSLLNNQRECLKNNPFNDYKKRIEVLKRLRDNINNMRLEIFTALQKDLNKSEEESFMTEVGMVLSEITYMIKHLKRFSKKKRVHTPFSHFSATSYKIPCAYGSVLIMSPWNYPFMLCLEPMVDAISAGNLIVLKPSERAPHVASVIERLIEATFSPEQVFVVRQELNPNNDLLDKEFDYIFYTGSTKIGKLVLQKASEHYTPVTLEMGGKSPCIVDETADIELSAKRIVFGKFLNAGQTCVAPDYVYCDKNIKDKLIAELKRQIILQYTTDPIRNPSYSKMINEKQFESVAKFITEENKIFGGKINKNLLKIEPTIINANFEDPAMQEEIFGPVLPIVCFENFDEAVTNINKGGKPLAFYIFSTSKANQEKLLSSCDFGGGCINDTIMHIASPYLPFGGIKQSGMGSYHGKAGFDTFSHYKSILKKHNWIDMPMRYQPMNKFKYFLIKLFLK